MIMQKKFLKAICFSLIASMISGVLLSGCATQKNESSNTPSSPAKNTSQTAKDNDANKKPTPASKTNKVHPRKA